MENFQKGTENIIECIWKDPGYVFDAIRRLWNFTKGILK